MARCFCCCGRKVKFKLRPMNTSGRRAQTSTELLSAVSDRVEVEAIETVGVTALAREGAAWCEDLAEITHGKADPRDFGLSELRDWQQRAWRMECLLTGRLHKVATQEERIAEACQQLKIQHWMASGLSREDVLQRLRQERPPEFR